MEGEWLLAVHSGAGRYGASNEVAYLSLIRSALESTREFITRSRSPPTAAEVAVQLLHSFERSSLTNAGLGANLTEQGRVECEASVVCGQTHLVSCCGAVRGVREPSALALKLLQQAKQVEDGDADSTFAFGRQPPLVVVGEHARQLARGFSLETGIEDDEKLDKFQVTDKAQQQWDKWRRRFQDAAETEDERGEVDEERFDTVGAICMDPRGNVAAALSSGGVAFKVPGRLGLAGCPRMGCDAANATEDISRKRKRGDKTKVAVKNAFAVACTGRGEHFIRSNLVGALARRLSKSSDLEKGLRKVLVEATENNDGAGIEGGVLALVSPPPSSTQNADDAYSSREVELGVAFTTPSMGVGFLQCRVDAEPQVQAELLRRPESPQDSGRYQLTIHVSLFRLRVLSSGK